jgi:hypothetical protein
LLDRFPVRINIDKINPEALEALSNPYLRDVAQNYSSRTGESRYSLRSFLAFEHLIENNCENDTALRLVFSDEAESINEAINVLKLRSYNPPRATSETELANSDERGL